jgi:RNA polymerase sigma-70 factor (ECF subfamily)
MTSVGRASGLDSVELGFDSRAEEALYRRNADRVFGFCISRLGRREDAEDAVQTTFLRAVRSLRRGVVPLAESAWLLGIARYVCVERWETAGRASRLESTCDPHELDRGNAAPEGRRDELIGLDDALTRLPEQQRRAILLRDWRGLSYNEVADQLGVSKAAVETLIFRGRRNLAELLREEPQQRRRLGSLGNLSSLVAAVKTAFTGAAAATKIATAVTVLAVSGVSVAVGPSLVGGGSEQPRRGEPQQPRIPVAPAKAAVLPTRDVSVVPALKPAEPRTAAARRAAPAVPQQAAVTVRPSGTAATAPVSATETSVSPALAPAGIVPAVPAKPLLATKPKPVEKVVQAVLPDPATSLPLPDALGPPVTAAVGTVVETLPTLPVDPAPVVPATLDAVPPLPPLLAPPPLPPLPPLLP